MIGNGVLNFFGVGGFKGENSVDVIVANWLIGEIVGVERFAVGGM